MRLKVRINPKTRVIYLPKDLVEDGFRGKIEVFAAGSVVVIIHPDADLPTINESLSLVSKDIELTTRITELGASEKSSKGDIQP